MNSINLFSQPSKALNKMITENVFLHANSAWTYVSFKNVFLKLLTYLNACLRITFYVTAYEGKNIMDGFRESYLTIDNAFALKSIIFKC
jgi:hypothetical protein